MRSFIRHALAAAVPVVALPVALLASPGTALAGGPSATVHITGQATLLSDGSVTLTIDYTCPPLFSPPEGTDIFAAVQQAGGLATTSALPVCDGTHQSLTLDLTTFPTGAITPGDASATVDLTSGFAFANDQTTVKVNS